MTNPLTIYKCDQIIKDIEALAAQNDGELTDEQMKQLVEAQTTSLAKLGSLCGFMKYLEHGMDACKKEEERIAKMRKTAGNRLASIKKFLTPYILERGKVTVDTFRLSTRKSTSVALDEDFGNMQYCKEKTVVTPDKAAIKEALKAGVEVEGASLQTNHSLQLK